MTEIYGQEETGRYLGIEDGYFFFSSGSNWVYCYCHSCWKNEILELPFVKVKTITAQLNQAAEELEKKTNELKEKTEALAMKTQEATQLSQELEKVISQLEKKSQELKSKSEELANSSDEKKKLQAQLISLEQALENNRKELSTISDLIKHSSVDITALRAFEEIYRGLDDNFASKIHSQELDPKSIQIYAQKEAQNAYNTVFKGKITNLVLLSEKTIEDLHKEIAKIEDTQSKILEAVKSDDSLSDAEITETLKPAQKKKEEKKQLKEKWTRLKKEFSSLVANLIETTDL